MKVLAISSQVPYPPHHGKAMRDYHLLTRLARRHQVDLLCMVHDYAELEAAQPLARELSFEVAFLPLHSVQRRFFRLFFSRRPDLFWRTRSASFQDLLSSWVVGHQFDLLLIEGLEMAAYGFWLREWLEAQGRPLPPIVLDEHNAEYLLQRRAAEIYRQAGDWLPTLYARVQARRLERYEALACRAADAVIAVSPQDRQALLDLVPEARISVVPNGVDTDDYTPLPTKSDSDGPVLVFTGHMGFRPNVDAVQWFCDAIWPAIRGEVPYARFQIVGRDPTQAVRALDAHPGVEVTGPVPDDRPYIGRADLYVLPMRFGGGIRLKLLQALSMGRPVVSTSMGAEGLEGLVDGKHLFLADQADSFVRRTLQLLRDPAQQRRCGQAGRELVVAGYDWRVLAPRFESVVVSTVQGED